MSAAAVVSLLRARTGRRFDLVGRMTGGETGAFEVLDPDGTRLVLKWSTDPLAWEARATAALLTARLRREALWPVPHHEIIDVEGVCQVVVQKLLPGQPIQELTHALTDQLLRLHERRLHLGRNDDPDHWADDLIETLIEGGRGYCQHEPLRKYSVASARLLARIEGIGRSLSAADLPGTDVVHWDFHPGNVLQCEDVVSAVIDAEYAKIGDAGFDLVTLALTSLEYPCERGVPERLWSAVDANVPEPRRAAYLAHMLLRQVDWSIRNHGSDDVARWLDAADRRLPS